MVDRHDRFPRDGSGEHDYPVTGREHRLSGMRGEIDAAMTGQPVVLGGIERSGHRGAWFQRPDEGVLCGRRSRAHQEHESRQ